jgi:hypothetical protein
MGNTSSKKGNTSSGYNKSHEGYVTVEPYVGTRSSQSNSAARAGNYIDLSISQGNVAELVVTMKTEKIIATREANRKMSMWVKR